MNNTEQTKDFPLPLGPYRQTCLCCDKTAFLTSQKLSVKSIKFDEEKEGTIEEKFTKSPSNSGYDERSMILSVGKLSNLEK